MAIEFKCECGEILLADEALAGKRGRCPSCQRVIRAPEAKPGPSEFHETTIEVKEEEVESPEGRSEVIEEPEDIASQITRRAVKSSSKGRWPKFPKRLSLGIPAVVIALFAIFLIIRSVGQKSERPGDTVETKETPPVPGERSGRGAPEGSVEDISSPQGKPGGDSTSVRAHQQVIVDPAGRDFVGEKRRIQPFPEQAYEPEEKSVVVPLAAKEAFQALPEKGMEDKAPGQNKEARLDEKDQVAEGGYTVNLGAFMEKATAERYVKELRSKGLEVFGWAIKGSGKRTWHLVSIGKFSTLEQAKLFAKDLEKEKGLETDVVKLPPAQD